jgi:2-polyprenyl-3-methyl-5-hydroxy-6-metoxy-1,4-benzoquinol methylase
MEANSNGLRENLWGYGKRLRFIVAALSDYLNPRSADQISILDVGCGNGTQLAIPLASYGFHILAIDPDKGSVERARQFAGVRENLRFENMTIEDCPTGTFDAVILSEVLEHLTDPARILADAAKRLRPGGMVIITVPNGYGEFEIDSWLFRSLRLQSLINRVVQNGHEVVASTENHDCGHVQFFTWRSIHRLFVVCNLELLRYSAGAFLCGPTVGHTLARSQGFIDWNARVTDRLPPSMASSWFFALRPRGDRRPSFGIS